MRSLGIDGSKGKVEIFGLSKRAFSSTTILAFLEMNLFFTLPISTAAHDCSDWCKWYSRASQEIDLFLGNALSALMLEEMEAPLTRSLTNWPPNDLALSMQVGEGLVVVVKQ